MLVLGIETSTPVSSIALWRDGDRLAGMRAERARGHVEFLTPSIRAVCADAGVGIGEVDAVAVGLGPGSFTSMRVGIATAKAVAQTRGVLALGICSLDLLAHAVGDDGDVCACIDARKNEVFAAFYRSGERQGDYEALSPGELIERSRACEGGVLFAGNGADRHRDLLARVPGARLRDGLFPSADALCELAGPRLATGEGVAPAALEPIYVRKTDAEIKWEERGVTIERPFRVKVSKNQR